MDNLRDITEIKQVIENILRRLNDLETQTIFPDGSIPTAKIADNAITTLKIADNAITTTKIAAGAVGTSDIADGAVTAVKIPDTSIPPAKLLPTNYINLKLGSSPAMTSLSVGSQFPFTTVAGSNGLTQSGNGVALIAGKTYRLEAMCNVSGLDGNGYIGYAFFNGAGAQIGDNAFTNMSTSATGYGFKAGLLMFYTPASNETITVRLIDKGTTNGTLNATWNSYLVATEV